jgi:hypothetical protein
VKKILGWLALALAAMWLLHNPAGAAADIRHIIHALSTLVSSL